MKPDGPLLLSLIAGLVLMAPAHATPLDVVLLLDDSGSMRSNDPERRLEEGVSNFLLSQDIDTRVAIISFADTPQVLIPLTVVDQRNMPRLMAPLASLRYDGRLTDTPAGVERALYELRYNARPDAMKAIVLMTDGVVDSGSPALDIERTNWLRTALLQDAASQGVHIYGLAFSEHADFQLLYALARGTEGEYFRANDAAGLRRALLAIDEALDRAATGPIVQAAPVATPVPAPAQRQSDGVQVTTLAQPEAVTVETLDDEGVTAGAAPSQAAAPARSGLDPRIIGAIGLLFATVAWFIWLYQKQSGRSHLLRRSSGSGDASDVTTRGVIYDVSDDADVKRYELGDRVTIIGRVAGTEEGRQYIVVRERTVGRQHASMERRGDIYWITDENSVNGTFVNDRRIYGAHPLKHGDNIRVHKHKFMFVIPSLIGSDRTLMEHDRIVDQAAS